MLLASAETTSPDVHGRRPWLRQTPDNPWGLFVAGTGQFGAVQGDGNADGYDFTTGGLTVGADYRALPSLVVGVMLGYAGSSADLDTGGGDIGADGARFGLYASWFEPRGAGWYLNAAANGGPRPMTHDTRRRVLGSLQEGETTGTEFTAYLGGGYDARAGGWTFGPTASLEFNRVDITDFAENGGLAPLDIGHQTDHSLASRLGARLAYQGSAAGIGFMPELRAAWQHEFLDRSEIIDARLARGAGGIFGVETARTQRDSAWIGSSLGIYWSESVSTSLSYDAELNADYTGHTVNGSMRLEF